MQFNVHNAINQNFKTIDVNLIPSESGRRTYRLSDKKYLKISRLPASTV